MPWDHSNISTDTVGILRSRSYPLYLEFPFPSFADLQIHFPLCSAISVNSGDAALMLYFINPNVSMRVIDHCLLGTPLRQRGSRIIDIQCESLSTPPWPWLVGEVLGAHLPYAYMVGLNGK